MGQIHHICINKSPTYTVASAPVVMDFGFFPDILIIFGTVCNVSRGRGGGIVKKGNRLMEMHIL